MDKRLAYFFSLIILLALFGYFLVSDASIHSPAWDEPNGLAVGYSLLSLGDFRVDPVHPPLAFMMMAAPLKLTDRSLPVGAITDDYNYIAYSHSFFSGIESSDLDKDVFLSRIFSIILSIVLAVFVAVWATKLYGRLSGIFALFLFVLSPVVIGNSFVAITDTYVSAFMFLTLFYFWRFTRSPGLMNLFVVSLFFSLTLLSKLTGLFLLPMFVILWLTSDTRAASLWLSSKAARLSQALQKLLRIPSLASLLLFMASLGAVFVLIAFPTYFFQFGSVENVMIPKHAAMYNEAVSDFPAPLDSLAHLAVSVPLPFPSFFVSTLQSVAISTSSEKTSFLFGKVYEGGKWQFFFIEFFLQNPIPFLILLLIAVVIMKKKPFVRKELFLVVPPLTYFFLFLPNNENSGMIHLLPLYPFLAVFTSRLLAVHFVRKASGILFVASIIMLSLWYASSTLSIHPHEYAFFNEFVSPQNGYKYILADRGDGLKLLKAYLDENNIGKIHLSYFGSMDPAFYGINYDYLPSPVFQAWNPDFAPYRKDLPVDFVENCSKRTGLIAISVTNLQNVHLLNKSCFDWLHQYEPVDRIGYSIFIYNITDA